MTIKKVLLVVGPESSGTRLTTEILSAHPLITGTSNALKHYDVLDDTWACVENNEMDLAQSELSKVLQNYSSTQVEYIVTRRSIPHAKKVGEPAEYMKFPNFESFYQLCCQMNLELVVFVLSRSPVANLVSWTLNRASAEKSFSKAMIQYQESYRHLFRFLLDSNVTFFMLPLEAILLEKNRYIQSLFQLLNLPESRIKQRIKSDSNAKRYKAYLDIKAQS